MITPEMLAAPNTEDAHQTALFAQFALHFTKYPQLKLAYAIPNGGKRDGITAARLKATGTRSGIPDICIPVSRCGYHALYIEMKLARYKTHKNGGCSDNQIVMINLLESEGNLCQVCYDWLEAWHCAESYLAQWLSPRQSATPVSLIEVAGRVVA